MVMTTAATIKKKKAKQLVELIVKGMDEKETKDNKITLDDFLQFIPENLKLLYTALYQKINNVPCGNSDGKIDFEVMLRVFKAEDC